jgi:hypothetical protein
MDMESGMREYPWESMPDPSERDATGMGNARDVLMGDFMPPPEPRPEERGKESLNQI